MSNAINYGYKLDADTAVRPWAASTFEGYETKISFSTTTEAVEYVTSDERTFRKAFQIAVAPNTGQDWKIWLWKGATTADLDRAKHFIEDAMDGNFDLNAWVFMPADSVSKTDRYVFGASVVRVEDSGYLGELRACLENACTSDFHEYLDGDQVELCSMEAIVHPDHFYVVHGNKGEEGTWKAWADAHSLPDGVVGIKAVRYLANDFAWMQGECDRLNEGTKVN